MPKQLQSTLTLQTQRRALLVYLLFTVLCTTNYGTLLRNTKRVKNDEETNIVLRLREWQLGSRYSVDPHCANDIHAETITR